MTTRRPLTEPAAWMLLGRTQYAAEELARVLATLAERNWGRIEGVPQHELARQAGISDRQVRRLLPALAAVGAIAIEHRPRYTTAAYQVDAERLRAVRAALRSRRHAA